MHWKLNEHYTLMKSYYRYGFRKISTLFYFYLIVEIFVYKTDSKNFKLLNSTNGKCTYLNRVDG